MKKRYLILGLLPLIISGCSNQSNKQEIKATNNSNAVNSTNEKSPEKVHIIENNNNLDFNVGYLEPVYNNTISKYINDGYDFNYTLHEDLDYDFTTDCYIDGKITFKNYEVTLDKVGLDYYYTGDLNKTSLYLRGDNGKIFYEFRSDSKAKFEVTKIYKFIYFND